MPSPGSWSAPTRSPPCRPSRPPPRMICADTPPRVPGTYLGEQMANLIGDSSDAGVAAIFGVHNNPSPGDAAIIGQSDGRVCSGSAKRARGLETERRFDRSGRRKHDRPRHIRLEQDAHWGAGFFHGKVGVDGDLNVNRGRGSPMESAHGVLQGIVTQQTPPCRPDLGYYDRDLDLTQTAAPTGTSWCWTLTSSPATELGCVAGDGLVLARPIAVLAR
jgi:hypothetical protein